VTVFLRGGSIIPVKNAPQPSSEFMKIDPYSLVVALNEKEEAFGSLFIDDFNSFDYKKGVFAGHN
jgi:mannosyl-oligosaccharide alpha-1,3-glucosidase